MTSDPYLDPDTWVLRNAFGIADRAELRRAEDEVAGSALGALENDDLPDEYGWELLSAIHERLFGLIYDWAGQIRTVGIAKDHESHFVPPDQIRAELDALETALSTFPDGLGRPQFVPELAKLYRQLNHIHPFREGNGRTQRVFWDLFCLEYGFSLAWHLVEKAENDRASRSADAGHLGQLVDMLDKILIRPEHDPAEDDG